MYFIIIHSIHFDDFLSVNRIFDKEEKEGYDVLLYVIVRLHFKNYKSSIKQLKTYVEVK